ncbi:molecular chaperone TorD, partial [Vibrio parahaemolyticus]
EGKVPMTLVMVHAQDHLMTTILAQEMAVEIVALNKQLANK